MISGRWRFIEQIKKSGIFCDITCLYALPKVVESDVRLVQNRFQLMDHEMMRLYFFLNYRNILKTTALCPKADFTPIVKMCENSLC